MEIVKNHFRLGQADHLCELLFIGLSYIFHRPEVLKEFLGSSFPDTLNISKLSAKGILASSVSMMSDAEAVCLIP